MVINHARVRINSVTSVHRTINFLLLRSWNIEHVITHGMLLILEFWLCSRRNLLKLSFWLQRDSLTVICDISTNEFLHLRVISDLNSINIELFARARSHFYLISRVTIAELSLLVKLIEMMVWSIRGLTRGCLLLLHAIGMRIWQHEALLILRVCRISLALPKILRMHKSIIRDLLSLMSSYELDILSCLVRVVLRLKLLTI
jgi:hypothetical protein